MTAFPALSPAARGAVPPFYVMEVVRAAAARQRTHGDAIALCVGQPSTPAPRAVQAELVAALGRQTLGYTETAGIPELREAVAAHYRGTYGATVDADDVLITTGSSGGFTALFTTAFNAGDTVVMTRPGYPAYRNTLAACGLRVAEVPCGPETRYQLTTAMLDALPEVPAGVIVASPANPTGTVIDGDELRAIARWCAERGVLLISDEIYHGITYGREAPTAWGAVAGADHVAVVGSWSKLYSMAGWRLGWMLLPGALRRPTELLLGNVSICPPAPAQVAAVASFTDDACAELAGHVARYAQNRDLVLRRLPELGVTRCAPPDGAFYAYFEVSHLTDDSFAWCGEMLERTGVALAPGRDFDPVDGHRFARLSFCGTADDLNVAFDRLTSVVGGSGGKR